MSSYPSIFTLGHAAIRDIFSTEVLVEEKLDGSQFSFYKDEAEELVFKSKNCIIERDTDNKLFSKAVAYCLSVWHNIEPGFIYRGEALYRPKHNCLTYARSPECGFVLFDVESEGQNFLDYEDKKVFAANMCVPVVPALYQGKVESFEQIKALLDTESFLGGTKIEGVVVKNYSLFTAREKKVMMGKYVSEAFKEVNKREWKKEHKSKGDIIEQIVATYKTPARWQKAVQHLSEMGLLQGVPEDIGMLLKEIPKDVRKEEEATIKQQLWDWAWKTLSRRITHGFPEYYKEYLAKQGGFNEG